MAAWGVFILDEPEAALSPLRQMAVLSMIHQAASSAKPSFIHGESFTLALKCQAQRCWKSAMASYRGQPTRTRRITKCTIASQRRAVLSAVYRRLAVLLEAVWAKFFAAEPPCQAPQSSASHIAAIAPRVHSRNSKSFSHSPNPAEQPYFYLKYKTRYLIMCVSALIPSYAASIENYMSLRVVPEPQTYTAIYSPRRRPARRKVSQLKEIRYRKRRSF